MRAKGWMLVTAMLLVALPLVVFVVGSTQRHMALPVTQAMHHRYFEVGYRQCEAVIKNAEAQAGGGGLVAVQVAIDTTKYPEGFRQDVAEGCQAASA